jgi:hypothetical protein
LSSQRGEDLVGPGVAAGLLLREDQSPVGDDVELAFRARDCGGFEPMLLERGRETRGPGVIARSDGAVEDLYLHAPRVAGYSSLP